MFNRRVKFRQGEAGHLVGLVQDPRVPGQLLPGLLQQSTILRLLIMLLHILLMEMPLHMLPMEVLLHMLQMEMLLQ